MEYVTLVFLFSDIEGSTARWQRYRDAMAEAVRRHDALLHSVFRSLRGTVFKTVGDEFCVAFATISDAVAAAHEVQRALAREDWSAVNGVAVRMAIHAGSVEARDGDYFGTPLNRTARLLATAHGGQIVLSRAAADLAAGALPPQTELRDLGRHRLRDFDDAENVYQFVASDLPVEFPPLRSLEVMAHNLPAQVTSFIGREHDIERVCAACRSARVVSLVGTGGAGKTRLALRVAQELLASYPDGAWFIDLSLAEDSDAVVGETAAVLSVHASIGRSVRESIAAATGIKRTLFVFDNCENVLDGCAGVIDLLLRRCPNTTMLVTSRQALDIAGEVVHHVGPMDVDQAVALFAERSRAVSTRFILNDDNVALAVQICERLDGIPLALELAAQKTAVLSLRALLAKLDERFRLLAHGSRNRLPRQQTLHAMIDWSYDVLDERERMVFRRLALFAGGWTMRAASAVCSAGEIDEWDLLDVIAALVAKNLVVAEPNGDDEQYRMLNTIRDYSRERLEQSGEFDDVALRHARFYAAEVDAATSYVDELEDVAWQRALAPEMDNVRIALDTALLRGRDVATAVRLLAGLEWPELLTTPHEAIRWFDAAAAALECADDGIAAARMLRHLVRLEWLAGRPLPARQATAVRAREIAEKSGEPSEIARAVANLGTCYREEHRFDEAQALLAQAYAEPDVLSAPATNAILRLWAVLDLQSGNLEGARKKFTDVAALERPGSEAHASALLNLGELEYAAGNLTAARSAAMQAKMIFAKFKAAPLALVLCNIAAYAIAAGDLDEARASLAQALRVLGESGARWMITALEHHALLAAVQRDCEGAALLLGFTDAHYIAHGETRQRTERTGYERLIGLLHAAYDTQELSVRLRAGAQLTQAQALALAAAISGYVRVPQAMTVTAESVR